MTRMADEVDLSSEPQWGMAVWPAAVFAGLGLVVLFVDVPVALWFRDHKLPGILRDLIQLSEAFADGTAVAVILAGFYILDRHHRRHTLRLIAMAYGSGLIADCIKLLIARTRPRAFGFTGDVWSTFQGWLPLVGNSSGQSFPSSHVAVAVGLALGMAMIYPHARWYFAALATLASLQRLQSGAHFPSDIFWAAAVSWAFCWWLGSWDTRRKTIRTT